MAHNISNPFIASSHNKSR